MRGLERCGMLVDMVFEKTVLEALYLPTYARLCKVLCGLVGGGGGTPIKSICPKKRIRV